MRDDLCFNNHCELGVGRLENSSGSSSNFARAPKKRIPGRHKGDPPLSASPDFLLVIKYTLD